MSECLCGVWKLLARLLQDMEAPAQILAFYPENSGNKNYDAIYANTDKS